MEHRTNLEEVVDFLTVASVAFLVESVDLIDGLTFVVSSQQEEVVRVANLVGQKQTDSLQILMSSVHVVAKEEI